MGIEIKSFTLKKVTDEVEFLDSLGKAQTARVKAEADIGVAEDEKDSSIKQAECKKEADYVKYSTSSKIEFNQKVANLHLASFYSEVSTASAKADMAYNLKNSQIRQEKKKADIYVSIVERRKQIEVEEKEIERKEKELKSLVTLPALAEAYKIKTIAEGMKAKKVAAALGEAVMIKRIGESEAASKEAIGKAEAKGMNAKAEAYKQYGESVLIAMVVENLAQIAHEVSKPLNKTNDIVLIDGEDKKAKLKGLLAENLTSVPPLAAKLLEWKEGKKQAWPGQDMLPPNQSKGV